MIPAFAAPDAAVALFKRFRTLIALAPVLALCAFLWVKLYGFLWWDGAIEQRDKARAQVVQCQQAGERNLAEQIRQREKEKAAFQSAYDKAKETHAKELNAAHAGLDRYLAANRLHKDGLRGGPASGTGQDQNAGSPEGMPASAFLVSEADLRICTNRTADTVATYEYFQGLKSDGLAE